MINLDSPDKEQAEDRVMTDGRLIEILLEKEARILDLERELSAIQQKFGDIARLYKAVSSIEI